MAPTPSEVKWKTIRRETAGRNRTIPKRNFQELCSCGRLSCPQEQSTSVRSYPKLPDLGAAGADACLRERDLSQAEGARSALVLA